MYWDIFINLTANSIANFINLKWPYKKIYVMKNAKFIKHILIFIFQIWSRSSTAEWINVSSRVKEQKRNWNLSIFYCLLNICGMNYSNYIAADMYVLHGHPLENFSGCPILVWNRVVWLSIGRSWDVNVQKLNVHCSDWILSYMDVLLMIFQEFPFWYEIGTLTIHWTYKKCSCTKISHPVGVPIGYWCPTCPMDGFSGSPILV